MPTYKHDCSQCVFLKSFVLDDKTYDVYRCSPTGIPTYIARYSDADYEYWSMPWDILKTINPEESTELCWTMFKIAKNTEISKQVQQLDQRVKQQYGKLLGVVPDPTPGSLKRRC